MFLNSKRASTAIAAGGILVALLACKKDKETEADAAPVETATAEPVAEVDAAAPEAKQDEDVVRYGDKESPESGTVRVLVNHLRVYKAADTSTDALTTLNKGTLVNLKARYGNFLLIEYPSGYKELSPGWIQAKLNSPELKTETGIKPEEVATQDAGAAAPSASASANAPDASLPKLPDAGIVVTDAGITIPIPSGSVPNLGRLPRLRLPQPKTSE